MTVKVHIKSVSEDPQPARWTAVDERAGDSHVIDTGLGIGEVD